MAGEKFLSGIDLDNRGPIDNSPDAVGDQQVVNLRQLNNKADGIKQKDPVTVRAQANVDIASAPATIDGASLTSGNRHTGSALLDLQTDPSENGLYIWNGTGNAMTRTLDANTATELNGAMVNIATGTDIGKTYRQTAVVVTLETDTVTFAQFGAVTTPDASETVKGKIEIATQGEVDTGTDDLRALTSLKLATNLGTKKVSGTVGDGSTQNPVITHNLGTKAILAQFYLTASPFTNVSVEYERTSTSAITLKVIGTPLASAELSYVISIL